MKTLVVTSFLLALTGCSVLPIFQPIETENDFSGKAAGDLTVGLYKTGIRIWRLIYSKCNLMAKSDYSVASRSLTPYHC